MHTRILYTVLLAFIESLCFCSNACGQVPGMRKYTLLDGFTANNSYFLDQDRRGCLWIGTDNGGMRFDGRKFTELQQFYRPEHRVILRCAFSDSASMLLLPFAGPMYSMNPYTFESINLRQGKLVPGFWEHGGPGGTFVAFNQKLKRAYQFSGKKIKEYKLDGFADSILVFSAAGSRFIGWGPGNYLYAYDAQNHTSQRLYGKDKMLVHHSDGGRTIHVEGSNTTFIYNEKSKRASICTYRPGDSIVQYNGSLQVPDGVTDILFAFLDKSQHLWLVFNNNMGVGYYDFPQPGKSAKIIYTLPVRSVHNVFIDHHQNVWLSTSGNSLYFLSYKHFKNAVLTKRFPMTTEIPKGITGSENEMCISYVNRNILSSINGDKTRLITLSNSFKNDPCLLPFGRNTYIAWGSRLGMVDTRSGHTNYMGPEDVSYKDVCRYDSNSLLAATSTQVAHITISPPGSKNIFSARASAVGVLSDKQILIGTPYGLFTSRGLGEEALKIKDRILQRSYILAILALPDSNALIGTDGDGVFLYCRNDSIKKIAWPGKAMPGQIKKIYKPKGGDIYWIASNQGVYSIKFDRNWDIRQLKTYTFYDGLPSNDVRDVYVYRDTAYVTTTEGLGIIPFADSTYLSMPAPTIHINNVRTSKRTFANVTALPPLPYDENDLQLSISAISYESLGNIRYYYRIYPLQKEWEQIADPDIQLNRLPAGTYTFEVYAVNAKGVKSLHPAQLEIKIRPAFWQTWWFIGLVLILVASAVLLIVYNRIRSVREQEQLRNDLHVYRDQALRGQMNPHFIYNSLNTIQNYILKSEKMASAFFLSKFSQLMRLTFDNTSQERITLGKDLEALVLYVELENMRFGNKISLHIRQDMDVSRVFVPPLILQPFVENAILHGFLSAGRAGNIYIQFTRKEDELQVSITDDGIGREQALLIKQKRQKYHAGTSDTGKKSGTITTRERIEQSWGKRTGKADFKIIDLQGEDGRPAGTTISFNLPLTDDQSHYSR